MTDTMTPLSDNIIIWETPDGSVKITQMMDDTIDVDQEIEKISAADPSLTFKFKGKLSETGVAINSFYGALVLDDDNNLAYDMVKARDIWRGMLRNLREPKFQELDIAYQRADEAGNTALKAEIAAQKNILRDCTSNPEIDASKSLNDLRRTLPEILAD